MYLLLLFYFIKYSLLMTYRIMLSIMYIKISLPVAFSVMGLRDPEDFQEVIIEHLLWWRLFHLSKQQVLKFVHRLQQDRQLYPRMAFPLCLCCDSIGRQFEWSIDYWIQSIDDLQIEINIIIRQRPFQLII